MPCFKNVRIKGHYALLAVPLALTLMPLNVQAGCSRDDIDHYLEKGFTPSQVTSICGAPVAPLAPAAPAPAPAVQYQQPAPPPPPNQQPRVQPPTQSSTTYRPPVQQQEVNRNFLIDVINGYDTILTEDILAYTMKRCYDIGEEDLFGFPPEVCPEIRYTLNLNGMKIIDTGRKYFLFGPPEIVLKGQVQREILTDLSNIDEKQKKILHKKVDLGDEVVLPIQQGTPMQRVRTELNKILR